MTSIVKLLLFGLEMYFSMFFVNNRDEYIIYQKLKN